MTAFNKNGIVNAENINTIAGYKYDKELHIEPDGSAWLHIVHHNNPTSYLFSSTGTFTTGVYIDANRWFAADACNNFNTWEMMIIQSQTAGGTEEKYRWVQKVNPMTATYSDVLASKVTYNTSSGYSKHSSYGGIFKKNSNSYLVAENGTNGSNWWGSVGCWTAYQGGIPGWAEKVITTGHIDLYIRVDNIEPVNYNMKVQEDSILFSGIIEY